MDVWLLVMRDWEEIRLIIFNDLYIPILWNKCTEAEMARTRFGSLRT